MEIGIAFDLRSESAGGAGPDDRFEEYDSLSTVEAVAAALESHGYSARLLGGGRELVHELLERPPELVFNMAEGAGTRSREAHVPALCELLGVPTTHSDPLTLAAALDKAVAKSLVAAAGLPTPRWVVVGRAGDEVPLEFPVIAKPLAEGSSMGLRLTSRADDPAELAGHVERLLRDYGQAVLVEEFCPGPELTVGILGTGDGAAALGVMEVVPIGVPLEQFVYSVEVKRTEALTEYHLPPRRPQELVDRATEVALGAYRALGCRDVGRIDLRVDTPGEPSFLEANPLPGLRPAWGDLPVLAGKAGVPFEELIGRIVACARERLRI